MLAACRLPERLRELCTKHGILLIFDEVITGFGRWGELRRRLLGVQPDLIPSRRGSRTVQYRWAQ